MPHSKKKDHKCSHRSESRWHNFHFSGKLIVCSVIFGMLLILIGGIVMAIGDRDSDDDEKSDNYDDIQKKPPMQYVGPVIMGIGGFTVIVGVFMCLVETKVCRRLATDASPLITNQGTDTLPKAIQTSDQTIPSTSRTHGKHRHGNRKKSPSPRRSKMRSKNSPSSNPVENDVSSSQSQPSTPINVAENSTTNFLSISDKFLTPPDTFNSETLQLNVNAHDVEQQTSSSLMKSFTSSGLSWTKSTEFQTPDASFKEDLTSLESSQRNNDFETSLTAANSPIPRTFVEDRHQFLTPKSSYVENVTSSSMSNEEDEEIVSEVTNPVSNEVKAEIEIERLQFAVEKKVLHHNVKESSESAIKPHLLPAEEKDDPVFNLETEEGHEMVFEIEEHVINDGPELNVSKIPETTFNTKEAQFNFNSNDKMENEVKYQGESFCLKSELHDENAPLAKTNDGTKLTHSTEVNSEANTETIDTMTQLRPTVTEEEYTVSKHQVVPTSNELEKVIQNPITSKGVESPLIVNVSNASDSQEQISDSEHIGDIQNNPSEGMMKLSEPTESGTC